MVLTALMWGCSATPREAGSDGAPILRMPPTIEVVLQPPNVSDSFRWEAETVARVLRTLEASLHAAPRVVTYVQGAPPPPSTRTAPSAGTGAWNVSLAAVGTSDALELRTLTCAPKGRCVEEVVYTNTREPEVAAGEVAIKILETIGQSADPDALSCVAKPPSEDTYKSLVAGRGAAVLYDILEPEIEGDRSKDPLERAVYLGPKMALAQWVAGRGRHARDQLDKAAYSLDIAAKRCPTHDGFAADLARVELDRGKGRKAEALVDGLTGTEDDPRLVPLRLDAWIKRDRLEEAEQLGLRANKTFPKDARVAQVLADLAEAQGKVEEQETWLQRWSERSVDDPEPLRRIIAIQARAGRWNDVWDSLDDLAKRGNAEEVNQWRVTAGLALSRYDEAAAAAPPEVAARIRARAALEGASGFTLDLGADPAPEARLARGTALMWGGSSQAALDEANAALRARPFWPEALALKADALQALGDNSRAEATRRDWRHAEPPMGDP